MLESFSKRRKIWAIIALPAWVLAGLLVAQIIVTGLLFGLMALGMDKAILTDGVVAQALSISAVYMLAIFFVAWVPWIIRKRRTTLKEIGLHKLPTWIDIFLAPSGFVVYLLLSVALVFLASQALPWFDITQAQDVGFDNLVWRYEYLLAFLALVVIVPVAEEVLFRGYLYGKMRKTIPAWAVIIITAVLFGAVHGAWNLAVDMFALGIILGLLREVTGGLWAPILLHMTKNAVAFYYIFINPVVSATLGA